MGQVWKVKWVFVFVFAFLVGPAAIGDELGWTAEFLSAGSGGRQIVGDTGDLFLSKLYPREVATMTGSPQDLSQLENGRVFAKAFFRDAVVDFTPEETKALLHVLKQVDREVGDRYSKLVRRPWRFLKTRSDLCGGFSFTRGNCIVLSQRSLRRIVAAVQSAETDDGRTNESEEERPSFGQDLLLHEQMHVLQRERPELFRPLYKEIFGFRKAEVEVPEWFRERQVSNPDGTDQGWVYVLPSNGENERLVWLGTLLRGDKSVHRMGADFNTVVVDVTEKEGGGYVLKGNADRLSGLTSLSDFAELTRRLPLPPVYDHVNEVGAYLLTAITHQSPPPSEGLSTHAAEVLSKSEAWFGKHLRTQ